VTALPPLGRVGVWSSAFALAPAAAMRAAAAEMEALGFGALWFPEGFGTKESLSTAALVLSATRRVTVCTGISNIWVRDPVAAATAARSLMEAFPDRFLLGLGVSHRQQVDLRGHRYDKPVAHMRSYLAGLDVAPYHPDPELSRIPRVLAALRPPMIELARECADGMLSYLVTPGHTASARGLLGRGPLLCAEQAILLCTDPVEARRIARERTSWYFDLGNYPPSLRAQGFTDADLAGGGSDRIIDALIAWGAADAIARRVREHLSAGADHVCIQPLPAGDDPFALASLRELAQALL
jgi:probable F420-dependent oxidoreductase